VNDLRLDVRSVARELGARRGGLVVAVLGYSTGRAAELHPTCAARLERAVREAEGADAVVLSGWGRRGAGLPEAELMRRAWPGPAASLVCDGSARTTAENAALVAALAKELGAAEVRVVTSSWHAARAGALFRVMLRGSHVRVSVACADDPPSTRQRLGELTRWALVPLQLALARRPDRHALS
jgi:uncharacterized SAM-binding protein YcdF (DUF218 family)